MCGDANEKSCIWMDLLVLFTKKEYEFSTVFLNDKCIMDKPYVPYTGCLEYCVFFFYLISNIIHLIDGK